MAANITETNNTELHFRSGKHKVLGMEGPLVEAMRNNAPKIVGGLRLASILMASVVHPLLGVHALFVLGSEAVLLLFGSKKSVEKHKDEGGEKPFMGPIGKAFQPHKYPLESSAALDVLGEIPHLILGASIVFGFGLPGMESMLGESAADIAGDVHADHAGHGGHEAVGEACAPGHEGHGHCAGEGALPPPPSFLDPNFDAKYAEWTQLRDGAAAAAAAPAEVAAASTGHEGHAHPTGIALMVHGALGVLGHLPLWLFGPEKEGKKVERLDFAGDDVAASKTDGALTFAQSESKVVGTEDKGVMQWFKDNQVVISSCLQMAIGVTMMVATGMPAMYQMAGVPLFAAGALQALFVRKREFSAEAVDEKSVENQVHSATHDGKVTPHEQQRDTAVPAFA